MDALTYGDRRRILDQLQRCATSSPGSDKALVEQATRKLVGPVHLRGMEGTLVRGALVLCYTLLHSPSQSVQATARTALQYLVLENDAIPDDHANRGLDDDVYVLHSALSRIRSESSETDVGLNHPYLTKEHTAAVEAKLSELKLNPPADATEIMPALERRLERLRTFCPAELIDELDRNAQWLHRALTESSDSHVAAWSLAALQYVSADNTVIPEAQGAVALLDDIYATQLALERCRAPRAAIVRTLDYCTKGLPVLNLLALRDGEIRSAPSEYAVVNLAAAQQLMEGKASACRLVHLPVIGGTPLLVAVLAALNRIRQRQPELSRLPQFGRGDLVQFIQGDKKAVGYFQEFEERKGINGLVVKDDRLSVWFPLTPVLLSSLSKASKGKAAGLHKMSSNIDSLPVAPLDLLFDVQNPLRFELAGCEVLFVCNSMERSRQLLNETTVLRTPLTEIVPVGRPAIGDDEREGWSRRWHATPPVLAVTSSLYEACNYLNTKGSEACRLVVIEDAATWENSADLLLDLSTGQVPVLAFAAYADEQKLAPYTEMGFKQARWDIEELEQLNWIHETPRLSAAERRIFAGLTATVQVDAVDSGCIDKCGEALELAGARLAECGGEGKAELMLGTAWSALTKASRWILPGDLPCAPSSAVEKVASDLVSMPGKRFLGAEAVAAFEHASEQLAQLATELRLANPKWSKFEAFERGGASITLIVANDRALHELRTGLLEAGIGNDLRLITPRQIPEADLLVDDQVLVPGWYKSEVMTRLLNPPVGRQVSLLLWGFEHKHYERWKARKDQVHAVPGMVETVGGTFRRKTRRTTIVVPPSDSLPPAPEDVLQRLEIGLVRASARRAGESSAAGLLASDVVDGVVVSFKEGQFAFFEKDGSAQVVTDVLRAPPDDAQNVRVRYKSVDELRDGDLVLFHTGSEADAIRAQADLLIEADKPGMAAAVRAQALAWRDALVSFRDASRLTAVEVASRLELAGCRRNVMTVRKWLNDESLIGPQSYATEVAQILAMTGDATLKSGLKRCIDSIRYLRGKHLQASAALARTLLHQAGQENRRTTGGFGGGLFVAEVSLVDAESVRVARRALRRLNHVEAL